MADRCREALRWITTLPDDAVRLQVSAGHVTLEGTVHRERDRDAAADTVRQIEGVAAVDNRIDVL
jgi:osmotically-inducible protein OsmY